MTDEDHAEALEDDMNEWFDTLPEARKAVITARMTRAIEDTVGAWDDDTDPVLVAEAFITVAQAMFVQDIIDDLIDAGEVVCTGIGPDGSLLYAATHSPVQR